ncbi:hypothetical protein POJ06DRAFT_239213 [Lipomyces tetrasporus]|uniref:SnoaL-like domain-containing protein n=1 Tax=Lipomyces tetrasporus TaxID=54092 RepID=A0AAD7VQV9_9ASCO|nr:uncharacterized protein POJ06DRAFT_239213 [Lipomyces tetrasporus]KAJ8099322.1 hypothetical protein POJ06DRAFT_239213 [Lipomyces tetrasporus]
MADPAPLRKTHFTNHKDTYEAALMSLFSGVPEDTQTDLDKMFTPDFTQRDDETTRDFPAFVKHIQWLRTILPTGSVKLTVTVFLRDGTQLAERHTSTSRRGDGSLMLAETFQFVEVAEDGRISSIVETIVKTPQQSEV